LKVVLASGDIVDLNRGEIFADKEGKVAIPLSSGRVLETQLPTYSMPRVRKHASGYFIAPGMDLIDLFIGSEGTLGVIVEAELKLLPKPDGVLSGVVFFDNEENLIAFVREARERSLASRGGTRLRVQRAAAVGRESAAIDARAIEYFDTESLGFLRQKYDTVPPGPPARSFSNRKPRQRRKIL
jgi:D-lactate dehydrogenase (cytochrome)